MPLRPPGFDPDSGLPPSARERAYLFLREALTSGELAPGAPLDIGRLGDRLRVSATPVREALARLEAEQLVRFVRQRGYFAVRPTATELRDLYALSERLLLFALEGFAPRLRRTRRAGADDYGQLVTSLQDDLLLSQSNDELRSLFARVDGRLLLARRCEAGALPTLAGDANAIFEALGAKDLPAVATRLRAFHRTRIEGADRVARALVRYRPKAAPP